MADKPSKLSYQPLTLPAYKPINYKDTAKNMFGTQLEYADANIGKQAQAQGTLTRGAAELTGELAPYLAAVRSGVDAEYTPQNVANYLAAINQADPSFLAVRDKLGAQVSSDLDSGYELGDALSREVEQDIRKGQTARGNWLGPAAMADEAFAKASARLGLYTQRQNAALSYLSSRAPSDMFSQYGQLAGFQGVNVITPTQTYVDASLPAQVASAEASNRNAYNSAMISAYAANVQAQTAVYDRNWQRYTASNPYAAMGSSGGGWGSILAGGAGGALSGAAAGAMVGSVVPGIGTAVGAVAGGLIGGLGGAAGGMA